MKKIRNIKNLKFPFTKQAMKVNDEMFLTTYNKIKNKKHNESLLDMSHNMSRVC